MGKIESAFFDTSPGDRVRILIEYERNWRGLFWIKLAKDGSVYLSPRKTHPGIIKRGKSKSDDNGQISINYNEGIVLENIENINTAKTSFHASGVINSLGERTFRSPLRDLDKQELLCSVFFQNPGRFDVIPQYKLEKRDICLKYPIEEDYPLFMHIFIAPTKQLQLINMGTEKDQENIVLQYQSIECIGDVSLQLSLFCPSNGPWPPYTYIIYSTEE